MNKNQLRVFLHDRPVGILKQTETGKKSFKYSSDAMMPISISMPIREEAYDDYHCEAFFGGLLPESDTAKKMIGKKYGVSPNNIFSLLKAIGYDCAGAISFHSGTKVSSSNDAHPLSGKIMTEKELYKHIKELPEKPLFMGIDGLKLSLAGVQDKAAICLIENQTAIPDESCPSTHIIKPASPNLIGIAENEYFILNLANKIGLPTPSLQLKKIKDVTFLLIERYDRKIQNKTVSRIHQEDFCQALGISSTQKYQNEGGPGLAECFNLIKKTIQPAVDSNLLALVVIFNYLVGNMDAHSKNFSLLHHSRDNLHLAPFYDLLCTRVYSDLSTKMAMKIGSKYEPDLVLARHWEQLCDEINYNFKAFLKLIHKTAHELSKHANQLKQSVIDKDCYHPIIDKIIIQINKNSEQLLRRIQA